MISLDIIMFFLFFHISLLKQNFKNTLFNCYIFFGLNTQFWSITRSYGAWCYAPMFSIEWFLLRLVDFKSRNWQRLFPRFSRIIEILLLPEWCRKIFRERKFLSSQGIALNKFFKKRVFFFRIHSQYIFFSREQTLRLRFENFQNN